MNGFQFKNRVLAMFLCVVMVGGLATAVFLKQGQQADAAVSLPGIEQLKASGDTFTILEIVPDVSQAAFAWYVGGGEPVNSAVLGAAYSGNQSGYVSAYQKVVDSLQGEGLLLPTKKSTVASTGILQYLGAVSAGSSENDVSGGFLNNEWFLRYVLDWSEDEAQPEVKVSSVSPKNVTVGHVEVADLVIISGGYYYNDSQRTPEAFPVDASNNLKSDVTQAILDRVTLEGEDGKLGLPLVLDRRAYQSGASNTLNSNQIFTTVLGGDPSSTSSGVYGSTFYFSAMKSELSQAVELDNGEILGFSAEDSVGGFLLTSQFNAAFADHETEHFSSVLEGIRLENSTRNKYSEDLLSEEITMARVIRHLIGDGSYDGTLQTKEKSEITILSLQPGDSDGYLNYIPEVHDQFQLTAPAVPQVSLPVNSSASALEDQVSWGNLENWTGVSRNKITVVELTMGEFLLESSDLLGKYDMIYIGNDSSAGSYGVYTEGSLFGSDTLADSKTLFAPVGEDGVTAAPSYVAARVDISTAMHQAMLEFVYAGRPVILAPYLCGGLYWNTSSTQPSAAAIDSASNLYDLLSQVSTRSNVMRQDILIAGADGVLGTGDDSGMWESCQASVHLSRPTITFDGDAVVMSSISEDTAPMTLSTTSSGQSTVEFIFKIENDSLVSGDNTYLGAVTFDLNGDNIYETNSSKMVSVAVERLQTEAGALVLDSSGEPLLEQSEASLNSLKQDQFYRVRVVLPTEVSGIVPLKVQATLSDDGQITSSVTLLCYVKPSSRQQISVLQVNVNGAESESYLSDNPLYQELLGIKNYNLGYSSSQTAEDFDFLIHSTDLATFNNLSTEGDWSKVPDIQSFATGKGVVLSEREAVDMVVDVLGCYDVVLMGFGAMVYAEELELAIEKHINAGGIMLFCNQDMDKNNLSFYQGLQALLSGDATLQSSGVTLLGGGSMSLYPYFLTSSYLQNLFLLNYGSCYYSNLHPASQVEGGDYSAEQVEEGQWLVNALVSMTATTLTFDDFDGLEDPGTDDEDKVDVDYLIENDGLFSLG